MESFSLNVFIIFYVPYFSVHGKNSDTLMIYLKKLRLVVSFLTIKNIKQLPQLIFLGGCTMGVVWPKC